MQLVFNIVLGELANTKKLKKKKGGAVERKEENLRELTGKLLDLTRLVG